MSKNKYVNRDLSWLSFNERVLQEAEDKSNSINDRLKFLAIFSSNLDEFFRVRISKLREFKKLQKHTEQRFYEKPKKIIKQIQKRIDRLQIRFGETFREKVLLNLNEENVFLINYLEFSQKQKDYAKQLFVKKIHQHIVIYNLKEYDQFNFIKDKSLFLFTHTPQGALIISIPTHACKRFFQFPKYEHVTCITFLDDIIKDNINLLLPDAKAEDLFSIKITRDGELYYEEEDGKLIEHLKQSLPDREQGLPTRVLYDNRISKSDLLLLRHEMNLKKSDIMPGGVYHNFSDFFQFPQIKTRISNQEKPQLEHWLEGEKSIIKTLKQKDALLCFPYQKFDSIIKLIHEASLSKDVLHIYISLYRVSSDSSVAKELLNCLKTGKQLTVFVEAKARFDEENNLEWGEKLEKNGARVLYSMPNIKVHSKIMLIEAKNSSIAYIGTGNFNEKSAKIYTDFGMLSARQDITKDLKEVFKYLLDQHYTPQPTQIWMSPFTTRTQLYERICNQIEISRNGGEGVIHFKMNSLEDRAVIDKFYEAAHHGVKVKLIVRGICCLNPAYKYANGNIEVISIVGKYLEHSRVYAFGNNGKHGVFIGSADCMTRNLDKRVEVITPVLDEDLKQTILKCLSLQWNDNTKARHIDAKQSNAYQKTDGHRINAQEDFKTYLQDLD